MSLITRRHTNERDTDIAFDASARGTDAIDLQDCPYAVESEPELDTGVVTDDTHGEHALAATITQPLLSSSAQNASTDRPEPTTSTAQPAFIADGIQLADNIIDFMNSVRESFLGTQPTNDSDLHAMFQGLKALAPPQRSTLESQVQYLSQFQYTDEGARRSNKTSYKMDAASTGRNGSATTRRGRRPGSVRQDEGATKKTRMTADALLARHGRADR